MQKVDPSKVLLRRQCITHNMQRKLIELFELLHSNKVDKLILTCKIQCRKLEIDHLILHLTWTSNYPNP